MEKHIIDSYERCKLNNLDPSTPPLFTYVSEKELKEKTKEYHLILEVVQFFIDKFLESVKGIPILVAVSDKDGVVLKIDGDQTISSVMKHLGFKEGIYFKEEEAGTNVVNLALLLKKPVELIGTEHYHTIFHQSACYATPFHYTEQNELLGTIAVMTDKTLTHPILNGILQTTVDSIERELMLKKNNTRLNMLNQILMESSRTAIVITDEAGEIIEFSDFFEQLEGVSRTELVGKSINKLSQIKTYIDCVLSKQKTFEDIKLTYMTPSDETFVMLLDAKPIYDEKNKLSGAFAQLRNITERHKEEEKVAYLALHDDLTGLPNRRYFLDCLEKYLQANQKENNKKFGIVFMDLDGFKIINDTLGHKAGDELLKELTNRLKQFRDSSPENIFVSRMGGDEFIMLVKSQKTKEEIIQVAQNILHKLEQPFLLNGYELYVTASLGIVIPSNSREYSNAENLMVYADNAMYSAKNQGKNGFKIYDSTMRIHSKEQLVIEASLRKAIVQNELTLHYQPQIDLNSNKLIGAEALVRWEHPDIGIISPMKFIPVAEETGLIIQLGEWVLKEACRQNKEWQDQGFEPLRISVNLSSQQFIKGDLVKVVRKALEEANLKPQYLELEITETMTMDVDHAIRTLNQLKELGVQVAIDDFGTGYSSLNYLKKFSIDRLKIDQSFVRDLEFDNKDAKIVTTIISMAHNLGLKVIAEGVEKKEHLEFLTKQNCHEAQGYYISKPLPAKKFVKQFLQR